jgi:hypothetical protein
MMAYDSAVQRSAGLSVLSGPTKQPVATAKQHEDELPTFSLELLDALEHVWVFR